MLFLTCPLSSKCSTSITTQSHLPHISPSERISILINHDPSPPPSRGTAGPRITSSGRSLPGVGGSGPQISILLRVNTNRDRYSPPFTLDLHQDRYSDAVHALTLHSSCDRHRTRTFVHRQTSRNSDCNRDSSKPRAVRMEATSDRVCHRDRNAVCRLR